VNSAFRERLQAELGTAYVLERELGGGGMSLVFLALDTALGRKVVVKVLPPDLAGGVNIDRLRREIALVAKLQHPHIVPVHAAGEIDGLPYYTMPYVEGQSLRARLAGGELPLNDVVWMLRDVAQALAYAHRQGVVHRDIKPDNVLLNGDSAVVTDFGVAKALSASAVSEPSTGSLTSLGIALGTPAYMSPEQAAASPQIDARSDIYALGIMAFEMISGHAPFDGRTPQQMLAAHLSETPPSIQTLRPSVHPALARLVIRCLEKSPADRPQSADEVLKELNAIVTPGGGTMPLGPEGTGGGGWKRWRWPLVASAVMMAVAAVVAVAASGTWGLRVVPQLNPRRVVVAPLENHTGDPSLDPVGRIASDWIVHGISQLDSIDVVSSTAAVEASGRSQATGIGVVQALAQRTRAGTVVWGAFSRAGDSIRFQVQVTDARSGNLVRSLDPVLGSTADPLPAITSLRERLMTEIAVTDTRGILAQAAQPPRYPAYREFALGVQAHMGERDFAGAIRHYRSAIALDSTFFAAYAYLNTVYVSLNQHASADSLLRGALRFRGAARGRDLLAIEWFDARLARDDPAQLRIVRRLAAQDSTLASLYQVAWYEVRLNLPATAVATLGRVDEASRGGAWFNYWSLLASAHHLLGAHEEEGRVIRRGRQLHPTVDVLMHDELRAAAAAGDVAGVNRMLDSLIRLDPDDAIATAAAARLAADELRAHGWADDARALYQRALELLGAGGAPPTIAQRRALALTLYDLGLLDSALAVIAGVARDDSGDGVASRGLLGVIAAARGDSAGARRELAWLARVTAPYPEENPSVWEARIRAALGERRAAVDALERARRRGEGFGTWVHVLPEFKVLRDYPPYQEFVRPRG